MGRFRTWSTCAVVALVLSLAGPAPAAGRSGEQPAPGAAKTTEGGHDAGHPDDPGPWAWADLAIWTVVVFLVLLWVLQRFAWGPMLTGLKQREDNIRMALDEAAKAREEAQALRAAHQKEM